MTENLYRLFFKAFSNQTRFKIIKLLKAKPLAVTEICEKLNFEQSRVSHNLRCLKNCGFVSAKQNGKWKKYALDKETILPIVCLLDKHVKKYETKLGCCKEISK